MKPAKTRHCEDCRFRKWSGSSALICLKGHRPKFFMPKSPMDTDWGWKKKCGDYRLGAHVLIIKASGQLAQNKN